MRRQLLARGAIVMRVRRQQQPRFQKRQPGRHHQIVGRQFDPQLARLFDEFQILLSQLQHRDLAQIDLLGARQGQQQVQRPLEPVDIDDQRLGGQPFLDGQLVFLELVRHAPCLASAHQARSRQQRCQWLRAGRAPPSAASARACDAAFIGPAAPATASHLAQSCRCNAAPHRTRPPAPPALGWRHRPEAPASRCRPSSTTHQSRSRRGSAAPSQARSLRAHRQSLQTRYGPTLPSADRRAP